jgi:dihydropyrimidine dehydrogenase (NAD+) subunit PreA
LENGRSKTIVREEDCVGCDLCSIICPVEGCISMVRVDDGKETKTWNELVDDFKKENYELTWKMLRAFQKKHGIEVH